MESEERRPVDYSQFELLVLGDLYPDIHTVTASDMFGVPVDRVTLDQRRIAKILNFAVIYGLFQRPVGA